MCPKNNINKLKCCLHLFLLLRFLHHASTHGNDHLRILLFIIFQCSKSSINTYIRILTHSTCIIVNKVRFFRIRLHVTDIFKNPVQLLRIFKIHLASKRLVIKCKLTSKLHFFFLYDFSTLCNKIPLSLRFLFRCRRGCIN